MQLLVIIVSLKFGVLVCIYSNIHGSVWRMAGVWALTH